MSYCTIQSLTTITVEDHKNLLAAWKLYGHSVLVGRFIVEKPLTEAQLRRLPKALKSRIEYPVGGAVDWLRALWSLPDTRTAI